ncbi:hypothetical protein vBBceHLY2_00151 [Bacillus phage vB_BceH_LY2]|nr:hypothetical protein vBBceHLY2_00151 [Bacillus phage vB_BceH_LY2]
MDKFLYYAYVLQIYFVVVDLYLIIVNPLMGINTSVILYGATILLIWVVHTRNTVWHELKDKWFNKEDK